MTQGRPARAVQPWAKGWNPFGVLLPILEAKRVIEKFRERAVEGDAVELKRLLKEAVPEYRPYTA